MASQDNIQQFFAKEQSTPDFFVKDICQEYTKLVARLQHLQPKRNKRRIRNLARPKHITPKVKPICDSHAHRKIQIVREIPIRTRTEQLAYPRVRNILPIRESFKKILGTKRLEVLNHTMKKSMLSLYSRLSTFQPPEDRKQTEKWTNREWAVHRRYLSKLAKPKKILRPPKAIHMWKDITIMKRFKELSKPKERLEHILPKWELTPGLRKYKPTPIIIRLAEAKEFPEPLLHQTLPLRVKPSALNYVPTERIKQLAKAPEGRLGSSDLKENPFVVVPNALKAKPSDRVVELSQPKEYEENHIRENPCLISPAALKAKASPRIIELAQPKSSA